MQILIISIITIVCILIFLNKNTVINAPIKLYKKGDSIVKKFNELNKVDDTKFDDIKDDMNLQPLDKGFPIYFTTLEKVSIDDEKQELLEKKRELEKVLKIKDSVYELEKDILKKNKKLIEFAEDTSERVLDAALDAEEQQKMAEKAVIWIKNAVERQDKLEKEAEKIKKEIAEKNVRLARNELIRQQNHNKVVKERQEKMIKLSLDETEQEIAKQTAIDASKKASAQAIIAESHKKSAEQSALAAESYKVKAEKEAKALIAKELLDKVKKELLNNKNQLNSMINNQREEKLRILNQANYEKEVLEGMKKELQYANKRVFEIEKEIKDKQGENMILTYKQKIAKANQIRGGEDKTNGIKCELLKTITNFNGDILDNSFVFNGKNNYIEIPQNLVPQLEDVNFTIEFWAYINSIGNPQEDSYSVVYKQGYDTFGNNLTLYFADDKNNKSINLDFYGGGVFAFINNIDLNKFNHFTIVFNNLLNPYSIVDAIKFYVNGKLISKNMVAGENTSVRFKAKGNVLIGKSSSKSKHHFHGELKKLKIYKKVLSELEINKSSKFESAEYCPKGVITFIPMNKNDNFIYTYDDSAIRKKNDAIINEIFLRLEYAVKQQRSAQDKWNNRKKILIEKLKKYKEDYEKNKANINLTREKFEFKLNEQLKAEKELLKKQSELDDVNRQNNIYEDELKKAEAAADKRIEIAKLKDRLRELDKNSRIMQENQIKALEEQARRLEIIENENAEAMKIINYKKSKKIAHLQNINMNIKDKGYVTNVNLYPIPSAMNQPYKKLYNRYPILQNNNILVLESINTAINVLNNFDTVEINGHVGKITWIEKNSDNNNLNYCLNENYKKDNLIDIPAIKYVCPASYEKKNKCYSCNDIKLDDGIIVITNLMPKLDKPILNGTLRKLDSGIVNSIIKYTPLEFDNDGDTRTIERLNIDCGEDIINQFRLLRGFDNNYETQFNKQEMIDNNFDEKADQIAYQYTCNKINKKGNIINKKTELSDDGNGKNYFLDNHNVNCQTGLITSFNLKTNKEKLFGKNYSLNYDYKCFIAGTKNCTNHYTQFQSKGEEFNNDVGDVKYLNKHNVQCQENKFLKDFNLESNDIGEIRYKYKCCELTKEGELSTGDIPDYFAKENIIFNGTMNEHSFVFNGINNHFVIPAEHAPKFSNKPFTVEFSFKIIKNKFSFILSQGSLKENSSTFFGIAIRSSATQTEGKNTVLKSINNKIYLTFGYQAWETVTEFMPNINYHFAVTYDEHQVIRMYINGLPTSFIFKPNWRIMNSGGNRLLEYKWPHGITADGNIYVGKLQNKIKQNNYFNGELSNLRIWTIDRTQEQIKNSINNMVFTKNLHMSLPLNKIYNYMLINKKYYTGISKLSQENSNNQQLDIVNKNEKLLNVFIENEYKDIKKLYINKNIDIYPNYKITFYLTIYEKSPRNKYTNILQLSTTNNSCCERGDRTPGFSIAPDSTKLIVSTGSLSFSNNNYNESIQVDKSLIPDKEYFIIFTRNKSNVQLIIKDVNTKEIITNIKKTHMKYQDELLSGTIQISNSFEDSAKGMIKTVKYYQTNTQQIIIDGREKQNKNKLSELEYNKKLADKYNNRELSRKITEQIELEKHFEKIKHKINIYNAKEKIQKNLIKITLGTQYVMDPLRIECLSKTSKTVKIKGSLTITKINPKQELKSMIPKNNIGPCGSNNKCSGYKPYNYCLGDEQDISDAGCNKYCKDVGGGYYRSDLKGCVKNYCVYPTADACSNGYFKKMCAKECINNETVIIGTLDLKPVWNNNYHSNLGFTPFEVISSKVGTIKGYLTTKGEIILQTQELELGKVTFNILYKSQSQLPLNLCINPDINIDDPKNNLDEINKKINKVKEEIASLKMKGGSNNFKNNLYIDMAKLQSSKHRI